MFSELSTLVLQCIVFVYKRAGVRVALLGLVRDKLTGIIQTVFLNDKGYWIGRHGGVSRLEQTPGMYRVRFHCLGQAAMEQYGSYMDFVPNGWGESLGMDHKRRAIHLSVHSILECGSDLELENFFKEQWRVLALGLPRKRPAIECD